MSKRDPKGLVKLPDGRVVAVIHGGEPIDGCTTVEMILCAPDRMALKQRMRKLDLWSPSISVFTKPTPGEVDLALDGLPRWRFWEEGGQWRPDAELLRE